jgi:hypothetical protein
MSEESVADKGYHDNRLLAQCQEWRVCTYIPERKQKSRCWTNKPAGMELAGLHQSHTHGQKSAPTVHCASG